MVHQIKKFSRG